MEETPTPAPGIVTGAPPIDYAAFPSASYFARLARAAEAARRSGPSREPCLTPYADRLYNSATLELGRRAAKGGILGAVEERYRALSSMGDEEFARAVIGKTKSWLNGYETRHVSGGRIVRVPPVISKIAFEAFIVRDLPKDMRERHRVESRTRRGLARELAAEYFMSTFFQGYLIDAHHDAVGLLELGEGGESPGHLSSVYLYVLGRPITPRRKAELADIKERLQIKEGCLEGAIRRGRARAA